MVLRAIGGSETMYILISIFKVVQFRSIYSLYVNSMLNRFGIDLMLCGVATVFLFSFLARIRFNFALSRKIRKERRKEKSDEYWGSGGVARKDLYWISKIASE